MKNKEEIKIEELLNNNNSDNAWIFGLLALLFLNNPIKEENKTPIINIYLGGEK